MNLRKQVVRNWELAHSAVAFALGNAPPSTNLSEFVMVQRVALIPAGLRPATWCQYPQCGQHHCARGLANNYKWSGHSRIETFQLGYAQFGSAPNAICEVPNDTVHISPGQCQHILINNA